MMVLDGATSHKAKNLQQPENIRLVALLPYAQELNPQEQCGMNSEEKNFPIKCPMILPQ